VHTLYLEMYYAGLIVGRLPTHICSFDHAKRAFYRSLNAVFGHISRSASEEVVINLDTHKCLLILLYGPEVCPVSNLILILLILLSIDS